MKYFSELTYDVNTDNVTELVEACEGEVEDLTNNETRSTLFSLLDITSLSEKDNATTIGKLCDKVNMLTESYPELPSPAAVCVYPEWVPIAKAKLSNPLVNVASVGAGFPASQTFLEIKLKEVEMAVEAGADEVDIVIPVGKFISGLTDEVFEEIRSIKEIMGPLHLKVILETGSLPGLSDVRKAAILAMDAGADFIKTSTGKAGSGAHPDSFSVMCLAIRDFYEKTGKKVGIKPAGGISTTADAIEYLSIVKHILGNEWLNPEKFRIGASRLSNHLIREIFKKDDTFSYFD